MDKTGFPSKQGLYDSKFEKDACGVGFVVNMRGITSHGVKLSIFCHFYSCNKVNMNGLLIPYKFSYVY